MFSPIFNAVFDQCVQDYHLTDHVDAPHNNTHQAGSLEFLLYEKNWIDTVQWHLEDIVINPDINPVDGLALKRRIDKSNQDRTDMVEYLDGYFLQKYSHVVPEAGAGINTESPAWAIDRLSILALKIYHMRAEVMRDDADSNHREACQTKLNVLLEQRIDLSTSIDALLSDIESGKKWMKVYKQMKMYNDPSLNPVLYKSKG
jgi:hypothetical protein